MMMLSPQNDDGVTTCTSSFLTIRRLYSSPCPDHDVGEKKCGGWELRDVGAPPYYTSCSGIKMIFSI